MAAPVMLLTDAGMDAHVAAGHPERPQRREAAAAGVRDAARNRLVERRVGPASDDALSRIHDPRYLAALDEAEDEGGGWLDADTYLVPGSMAAARLAAGATLQAARAAMAGEAEVAFAAVRPPGHHAAAARGSGFCLLNNIAVAVAALRADGVAGRVAIVDWDVHHGDGTQAIFENDPNVLYASTHQAPFYPGTGHPEERGIGGAVGTMLNRPLSAGEGDVAFVEAWTGELLPAIETFAPEAILVSAGYDAHRDDPLAGLRVTEAGYLEVALALGRASARLALPGVALTLEGGYDLDALRAATGATVRGILAGRAESA
ncbi:MAG TPA: histone deacetylase [Candidatus Limnocylindria bacterium]|nr:histone deacetylase [Candidatus Limnocylindria bacterium]